MNRDVSMQIQIRYFASLRESLGAGEALSFDAPLTVGQLRDQLIARGEPYAGALLHSINVNTNTRLSIKSRVPEVQGHAGVVSKSKILVILKAKSDPRRRRAAEAQCVVATVFGNQPPSAKSILSRTLRFAFR